MPGLDHRVRRSSLGAVIAIVLAAAAVASAVQTNDFGLAATGNRTALEFGAGPSPVTDTVELYNRTGRRVVVDLGVVGATRRSDGTFAFGDAGQGLAADIALSASSVALGPHAQRLIVVTVRRPERVGADEWAAITAIEKGGSQSGVAVRQRLAVFVGVLTHAPGGRAGRSGAAAGGHHASSSAGRWVAVAIAVLLAAGGLLAVLATRRRRTLGA
jgi:hypothetical protein